MYDLIIIGGGPGGVAAGVYAARKKLRTLLVTKSFGGQSIVSGDIQNWIGDIRLSGVELAQKLEAHVRAQQELEIIEGDVVERVKKEEDGTFTITTKEKKTFETKTILVTAGSHRRRLGVPGEAKFEGLGVVFCATCDAPLFGGRTVAVVGGGNSGLEATVDLLQYAEHIYLLDRNGALKGDAVTQEKIRESGKVTIVQNALVEEVLGEAMVTGLRYTDKVTGEQKVLNVQGVFVEIGAEPNSGFVEHLVERNGYKEIVVDKKTQETSCKGIWAAGDVCDVLYKQNNISVGDAIKAVLNIQEYLQKEVK
jgi:alkyl hydroperoxide reductase subunit AhpF